MTWTQVPLSASTAPDPTGDTSAGVPVTAGCLGRPVAQRPDQGGAAGSPVLTIGQEQALARLAHAWEVRQAAPVLAGVRPRAHPLIVGPSGAGKTFLACELARRLKLPLLAVTAGGWVVHGAREPRYTLTAIAEFVEDNPCGVIFVDEIDKLDRRHAAESAWGASVQQELFALLDGDQRLDQLSFPAAARARLGRDYLIIGAGAWQAEARAALEDGATGGRRCGFAQPPADDGGSDTAGAGEDFARRLAARLLAQDSVAEELLYRFALPPVILGPPLAGEVIGRILALHAELGMAAPAKVVLNALAAEALASRRAVRWLEGYAGELLWTLRGRLDLSTLAAAGRSAGEAPPPPSMRPNPRAARREQGDLLARFMVEARAFTDALWRLDLEVVAHWRRLRREEGGANPRPERPSARRGHGRRWGLIPSTSDPTAAFLRRLCAPGATAAGGSPRPGRGAVSAGWRPQAQDGDEEWDDILWIDALETPATAAAPVRGPASGAVGGDSPPWEGGARLASFVAALDEIDSALTDNARRGQLFADLNVGVAPLVARVEAALREGLLPTSMGTTPGDARRLPAAFPGGTDALRSAALEVCAAWRRCAALQSRLTQLAALLALA